jgi:hypothetical protein
MDWRCGSSSIAPVCKSKTLSSNPSPTKNKKMKRKIKGTQTDLKSSKTLFFSP